MSWVPRQVGGGTGLRALGSGQVQGTRYLASASYRPPRICGCETLPGSGHGPGKVSHVQPLRKTEGRGQKPDYAHQPPELHPRFGVLLGVRCFPAVQHGSEHPGDRGREQQHRGQSIGFAGAVEDGLLDPEHHDMRRSSRMISRPGKSPNALASNRSASKVSLRPMSIAASDPSTSVSASADLTHSAPGVIRTRDTRFRRTVRHVDCALSRRLGSQSESLRTAARRDPLHLMPRFMPRQSAVGELRVGRGIRHRGCGRCTGWPSRRRRRGRRGRRVLRRPRCRAMSRWARGSRALARRVGDER